MNIPTLQECNSLHEQNGTPKGVITHCMAVSSYAVSLANKLRSRGISINVELVRAAAALHDIEKLKRNHVVAGYDHVKNLGFLEVAQVMLKHGLEHMGDSSFHPRTMEEKIVFYADKRLLGSEMVPLEKRFEYIRKKYNYGSIETEFMFSKKIEEQIASLLGEAP